LEGFCEPDYYWIGAELSQTSPLLPYEGDGQTAKKVTK
jgi:hypothetical protein